MVKGFLSLLIVFFLMSQRQAFATKSTSVHLVSALMNGYDRRVRPVANHTDTLGIDIKISLIQIISLQEVTQEFHAKFLFYMSWRDEFLTWDPISFDNISDITLPAYDVWLPDVIFYDSLDRDYPALVLDTEVDVTITSEGMVAWAPIAITHSTCSIDVADFPFDHQVCNITFGSWVNDAYRMNFTILKDDPFSPEDYFNVIYFGWDLISFKCTIKHINTFELVVCSAHIDRQSYFYIFNLTIPGIVLLVIGSLTFWLPAQCGEKVSLSITVLLAMTVFMMVVMEGMPPIASSISHIQIFLVGCFFLLGVSTLMAVVVTRLSYTQSELPASPILQTVVLTFISKLVCAPQASNKNSYKEKKSKASEDLTNHPSGSCGEKISNHSPEKVVHKQYQQIALVLDRLFYYLYLVSSISIIIFFFSKGWVTGR